MLFCAKGGSELVKRIKESSYEIVGCMDANASKREFCRVLKREGIIVTAVPVKEKTFDHNRGDTLFEHLCEDYDNDVKEDDLTHLPEILELHDYGMDLLCGANYIKIK